MENLNQGRTTFICPHCDQYWETVSVSEAVPKKSRAAGSRELKRIRNENIVAKFKSGTPAKALTIMFDLSIANIYLILRKGGVHGKKKKTCKNEERKNGLDG